MKILTFQEFAALPAGTIFSYYKPHFCEGLYQKGETYYGRPNDEPSDYRESRLLPWLDFETDPPAMVVDDSTTRWGLHDYDQLYAVYEKSDLEVIQAMIVEALAIATQQLPLNS